MSGGTDDVEWRGENAPDEPEKIVQEKDKDVTDKEKEKTEEKENEDKVEDKKEENKEEEDITDKGKEKTEEEREKDDKVEDKKEEKKEENGLENKIPYPCPVCGQNAPKNAVLCGGCLKWCHKPTCSGLNRWTEYKMWTYRCPKCKETMDCLKAPKKRGRPSKTQKGADKGREKTEEGKENEDKAGDKEEESKEDKVEDKEEGNKDNVFFRKEQELQRGKERLK